MALAQSSPSRKVALVSNSTALSSACPTLGIVDLVGFGASANCSEGAQPTAAPSNTTAAIRAGAGCTDTNVNSADFAVGTPNPRNSATTAAICGTPLARNESGAALEANYCNVQYPPSLGVQAGATTDTVYGQVNKVGLTDSGGDPSSIVAQLGYGPLTANPEYETGWTWTSAAYNSGHNTSDNNYEYQASFTAPAAGTYGYVYRFSLDNGVSWTVCDNDGAGSNNGLTFDLANIGVLTVAQ